MTSPRLSALVLCASVLSFSAPGAAAQGILDKFIDPLDGQFDASGWFASKGAFLPVPLIVTEPAVGAGGGLAAVWFHGKHQSADPWAELPEGVKPRPPSISVLGGVGTTNGTWAAGGGHFGTWKEDSIRYRGFAGLASANLDFYSGSKSARFNIEALFLLQDLRFRIQESPVFVGARYLLSDTDTRFDRPSTPPALGQRGLEGSNAGLGPVIAYDDRDNIFTPTRGTTAELTYSFFDEAFGGDFDYQQLELKSTHHRPLVESKRYVLGVRGKLAVVDRQAPFYAKPFVELRGVPAMRFQGDQVLSGEAEVRWVHTPRWSSVGFFGLGGTQYESSRLEESGLVVAGGVGVRYKLARLLGLHGGVDLAMGPDGPVLYLSMGSGL